MKPFFLILSLATVAAFSSCTSAYRSGQTPDDLYYSPVRAQDEYVRAEKKDDRLYQGSDQYYEDRYLRMRVGNPYRWSALDDYYFSSPYGYNAFRYSDPWAWSSPWNNYWSWNYFYNPYWNTGYYGGLGWGGYGPGVIVVTNPKTIRQPLSRPLVFNPNSYGTGGSTNNRNTRMVNSYRGSGFQGYNNTNTQSTNRRTYSNDNYNYNNSNNSNPNRSYSPSSSNGGSNRSSGGGGGGVSRPGRN